jgi:predicted RNase H-like nuclease (RuvC/YqgF family)
MLTFLCTILMTALAGYGVGCLVLRGPQRELAELRIEQKALDREFDRLNRTLRELHGELVASDPDTVDTDEDDDFIDDRNVRRRNKKLESELAALRREVAAMEESFGDIFGDEFSPDDRFTLV